MKTDETLGKTGAGPEGLPHSIIVTAEGIEGEVSPAIGVSAAVPIEEKTAPSKPVRRQTVKARPAKKGSSSQQQAGVTRTGRKAYSTGKKK